MKCLSINGVASALNSLDNVRLHAHLGIIILTPRLKRNATGNITKLIKKLHELQMDTSAFDWLIAARSNQDYALINEILNATSIRFDQNIVVGYTYSRPSKPGYERKPLAGLCDTNFIYKINRDLHTQRRRNHYQNDFRYMRNNQKTEYERNYYRTSERFRNLTRQKTYKSDGSVLPLFHSGVTNYNYSRMYNMVNVSKFSLNNRLKKHGVTNKLDPKLRIISMIQYFKVRTNSTLYAYFLGNWNQQDSMSAVEAPYPVEARNFLGEKLIIGRCNSTMDGSPSLDDDGPPAGPMLDDILHFLTVRLNTTSLIRYYGKLGFRTYEGTWTGLLGALMDHSVDMALEPVTVHATRRQDMDFIFPIAETMCNIYIRQQETSTVRDIFLAPFSVRLVLCVVAVALVAALAIVIISRMTSSLRESTRKMGYTEALIWSTGILCQQGGTWTPSNPAASVLLIVCLFFAVVTYNAYAAFITSVLSVRVASVDTIAAVLHSPNFKIGYIRNGADQMYLMSTKDVQLNAFYIRGYSDADNLVSSAEEGLARAARQDYAFFAGQRVARSTLRSLSQARGRCAVRELPVHSTRAHLAFPLPRHSPYARPTLVSLLQLRSGGALARLEAALVPDMPQCAPPPGFASARATDVRSALILLTVGLISSLILGVGEYCWKNRQKLKSLLKTCYGRLIHLIMQ
ncbi:putative glutamate receptor isoform X3 [Anticarsia gemmatalis]